MERSRVRLLDIFFSIFIAIGLWAYVINVVNPPMSVTIRDVPVQVLGLESIQATRLTIAGDGVYTCDVTVNASRSEVSGVTADDLSASINLTGLSAGQNYVNVRVTAPSNITVEDIRSEKIQVYIDELVTEQKPVNIVHADIEGDYEVTITAQETDSVLVTGAKSLVSMISEVRVDLDVNALSVDASTTERLTCTPLDSEGNVINNVKLSHEQIYVTSSIYQIHDVPLSVSYEGAPGLGAQLSKVELPQTLSVKGKSSQIRAMGSIPTDPINIEGIIDDTTVPVKYHLPEGVYLAEGTEDPVATFTLIHTGEISFSYGRGEIVMNNVPEDCLEYSLPEDTAVTVTAKGDLSAIRTLEAKDLQPYADLSGLVSGDNRIELQTAYKNSKVTVRIRPSYLTVTAVMEEEEPPQEPAEGTQPAEGGKTEPEKQ